MMSNCRNSVNSLFTLLPPPPPLPLLEEDHHFSHAYHQTLGAPFSPPPKSPSNLTHICNPLKHISVTGFPAISTGEFSVEKKVSGNIDLMSCTESLGFESSDEMISSFDDLDFYTNNENNNNNNNSNPDCFSFSSRSSSSNFVCLKRREKEWEEKKFPPPLASLGDNGRRNFILKKSVKKDGRLEIIGVMIQRPEILRATRNNGRLRLNLVRNFSDDEDEEDEQTEEKENEEEGDKESGEEEERECRIIPPPPVVAVVADAAATASLRRCYQQYQVWGPQQQRCVTTI